MDHGHHLPGCYRHPGRETGVTCSRCERPICPDCMINASVGFHCPECHGEEEALAHGEDPAANKGMGAMMTKVISATDPALVTKILIAINVVIFIVAQFVNLGGSWSVVAEWPPDPGGSQGVAHGEWWLLLTSMFVHVQVLHLVFNLVALWFFGPLLEDVLGRIRFLILYLLSGLGGSALFVLIAPENEAAVGASGAIYGIFGAVVVLTLEKRLGFTLGPILLILGLNLGITFAMPDEIAWQTHIGGLIVGSIMAHFYVHAPNHRQAMMDRVLPAVMLVIILGVVLWRTLSLN